jgi:hypothetical protein
MKEEVFRLTKSLLAVKFCTDRAGLLLKLPAGADVYVLGSSVIPDCLEIVYNDEHYNIFKRDLLCHSTGRRASMAATG